MLRRFTGIVMLVFALTALGGCTPGAFPLPTDDRTKPPKPSKTGVTGTSGYQHGGTMPTQFDAGAG